MTPPATEPTALAHLESEAHAWPDRARALAVTDHAGYARAADFLLGIKGVREEIAQACDPVIAAAHRAHQAACQQKRALEAPLVEAEGIVKEVIAAYLETEEKARRRREAELAREAARLEEEARRAEAEALEAAGESAAAAQVAAAPLLTAPILLPKPRAEGIAARESWTAVVVSLRALCHAVAVGRVPETAVLPNGATLNAAARAMKSAFNWPGCRAVRTTVVAAGRR